MNKVYKQNWLPIEINALKEYNNSNCTIQDLSEKIGRTPNAIAQKLYRMKYINSVQEARGYQQFEKVSKYDLIMQELNQVKTLLNQLLEKK